MMKVLYVTVRVVVKDDVDTDDFASNVDYNFNYPGLDDTEIVDVTEQDCAVR